MYFTKSVSVAILAFAPSVVFGQSQSTGQTTGQSTGQSSSGSSNGQNIVQLGAGGNLMFTPNMMTVNQGDNVTFAFMTAAHAVMSTSLSQPNVADDQVYSGIIPVDNTTPTPPGKKLPKNKLRVRGSGPMGGLLPRAKKAKKAKGQATQQNSGIGGTATFTVQMNNVGMQAFVCPAAQHAANGMIMMINVLPAGTGANNQKRQNSDAQLQRALTNYLAVGQKTKTVQPSVNAGTGGTLNSVAAQIAQ